MNNKLVLTKQKLFEILEQENNDVTMEEYYNIALNGEIVASEHMAIVAFLLILIRYKKQKMLNGYMNPFHFFGVPEDDLKKYSELLYRTNYEIFQSLSKNENIPNQPLIEFSEDIAFMNFWENKYFQSLCYCENALKRDENSFISNFIKASIVEVCFINKTNIGYKIRIANYQKRLIDKCNLDKLNFNKEIYIKVKQIIEDQYSTLDKKYYGINFTMAPESFEETKVLIPEWTKEYDFYLRNKLFLNPLCDFDLFIESSIEEMESLNIEEKHQKLFDEIVDEFKLCRYFTFNYNQNINKDSKRVQCMVFSYTYSILDKLAFLLKQIYNLKIADDKVSFTQGGFFDLKFQTVDKRFRDVKNINIYPLYSIMKSVHSKQKIEDSIKLVIFDFFNLRNIIEHRTTSGINEQELRIHSIYILKTIKEAILYSYMLIKSFSGKDGSHNAISALSTAYCKAISELEKEQRNKEENK